MGEVLKYTDFQLGLIDVQARTAGARFTSAFEGVDPHFSDPYIINPVDGIDATFALALLRNGQTAEEALAEQGVEIVDGWRIAGFHRGKNVYAFEDMIPGYNARQKVNPRYPTFFSGFSTAGNAALKMFMAGVGPRYLTKDTGRTYGGGNGLVVVSVGALTPDCQRVLNAEAASFESLPF